MHDSTPPGKEAVDQSDNQHPVDSELCTCPRCGVTGLPERLAVHTCAAETRTPDTGGETDGR